MAKSLEDWIKRTKEHLENPGTGFGKRKLIKELLIAECLIGNLPVNKKVFIALIHVEIGIVNAKTTEFLENMVIAGYLEDDGVNINEPKD